MSLGVSRRDAAVERSSPLVSVLSTRICLAASPMNWVKRSGSAITSADRPFDRMALRTFRWFSVRVSSLGRPRRSRTYQRAASPDSVMSPTG